MEAVCMFLLGALASFCTVGPLVALLSCGKTR